MSLLQAEGRLVNWIKSRSPNAFVPSYIGHELVFEEARKADTRRQTGTAKSPIDGQLIALKDNFCTLSEPTTCASKILEGFRSPYAATVVQKLKAAGAIIPGKTNLDEFGMGSHSTHSIFGHVESPLRKGFSVGGSSGGSAAAVENDQCLAALGTDTGGSVRLPAAWTGIAGFKPSYGMISRWGVVAYANSLDTVGVIARQVETIKLVYGIINGFDSRDPTSLPEATRLRISAQLQRRGRLQSLRIGVPVEYNTKELQPPIKYSWLKTLERLKRKGHSLHRISLPATRSALSAYYVVAPAEASSNLAKYDGVRYGMMSYSSSDPSSGEVLYAKTRGRNLGNEVQKRILLGSYSLSAEAVNNYFIRAQKVRRLVQRDFNKAFALSHPLIDEPDHPIAGNGVDVIVTPTTTNDPPLLQDVLGEEAQGDSAAEYKNDVFTVPASLAGLPSLSVPVQEIAGQELKTGMQVIGQYGDDDLVLRLGKDIEAAN